MKVELFRDFFIKRMPLIGAFVFPHGAITLDPETRDFTKIPAVKPSSKEECIKLHNAMELNAAMLVDARPDLIILSTPHGLKIQNNYLFLGNSKVLKPQTIIKYFSLGHIWSRSKAMLSGMEIGLISLQNSVLTLQTRNL